MKLRAKELLNLIRQIKARFQCVVTAADGAERSIVEVASLITADRKRLRQSPKAGPVSYRLFELLPMMPRFTVEHVRQRLKTTFPTASAAVKLPEQLGIVAERTGQMKNRVYSYKRMWRC